MPDGNELKLALDILRVLLVAVPAMADWIRDLTEGRTDPFSVRVRDILPEESESRKAERELG